MLEENTRQLKKKKKLERASTQNVTLRDTEMEHLGKRWHSKYLSKILLRPVSLHYTESQHRNNFSGQFLL